MITDTLQNIISRDKNCLLGLTKRDKSKYLYSIAPLNADYVYPNVIDVIDVPSAEYILDPLKIFGEWSSKSSIYEASSCFLASDYDGNDEPLNRIYSSNDWEIKTSLDVSKNLDKQFTFTSLIKFSNSENLIQSIDDVNFTYTEVENTEVETVNSSYSFSRSDILNETLSISEKDLLDFSENKKKAIENSFDTILENGIIQIYKQGTTGNDGIFDAQAKIYRDKEGFFGKFDIYVYFKLNDGTVKKHKVSMVFDETIDINEYILGKFLLFSIMLDIPKNIIKVYFNDILYEESQFDVDISLNNPILNHNESLNNTDNFCFKIGGTNSKKIEIGSIFIFNRILSVNEILMFKNIFGNTIR